MAHNSFVLGGLTSGAWNIVPQPGDFEQLDQYVFESINGDKGGTWAPALVITIGGAGLTITGPMITSGTLNVNGAVTFSSTFALHSPSTIWNKMTIDGANTGEVYLTSGALLTGLVGSTMNWAGAANFDGATTFTEDVSITGAGNKFTFDTTADAPEFKNGLTVSTGTANFNSTTQIGGFFNCSAVMVLQSSAHIRYRYIAGANANATYGIADADHITATPSATRAYTMSNTGCSGGEVMSIFNESLTQTLNVYQHNGSTLIVAISGALAYSGVEIINDGTGSTSAAWRVKSATHVP